jgi:hypothetical protein
VKVTRVGDAVLLEPIEEQKPFDADAFWAKLDALGARNFLPEGLPDDAPLEPDEISFDRARVLPRHDRHHFRAHPAPARDCGDPSARPSRN